MWNRKDDIAMNNPTPSASPATPERPSWEHRPASTTPTSPAVSRREGIIGKSICIRGELTGNEDLTVDGKVEGKIDLEEHNLTIGPSGRITAEVTAKTVIVQGEIEGNITAGEKIELASTGRVKGDVTAPRVAIADGAHFKGMVNMTPAKEQSARPSASTTKAASNNTKKTEAEPAAAPRAATDASRQVAASA